MSTVVSIMGMHRSGTSMITRLLNICGLHLGDYADLIPAQPENPEGYWENRNFVLLNDDLLTARRASWDQPPAVSVGWSENPEFAPLYHRARGLLHTLQDHDHWGWKDPRNCLTLEFWKTQLPQLKTLICLRNPLEIAASLISRGFSFSDALALCLHYFDHLALALNSTPTVITHYDSYFYDPCAELERVTQLLGIPSSKAQIEEAAKSVSVALHRQVTPSQIAGAVLPVNVAQHYHAFCLEAGTVYQQMSADLKHQNAALERYALTTYHDLKEKKLVITAQTQQIGEQQAEIERLSTLATDLNEQIAAQVEVHQHSLSAAEQTIVAQQAQIGLQQQELQQRTTELAAASAQLTAEQQRVQQSQAISEQRHRQLERLHGEAELLAAQIVAGEKQRQDLQAQVLQLTVENQAMRGTKGWQTLEAWWRVKSAITHSAPYLLLRTSSLIIIREGPLAFVRQLGRWIKGERGYYRRFEQVSPVREPVPEPDTSHLQWTAEQPELSDSIAGIVTIRGSFTATTGVKQIELRVNGQAVTAQACSGQGATEREFEFLWDASLLAAGSYEVSVHLISERGSVRQVTKTLWVQQTP